jgi:hypothetical protein
MTNTRFGSDFSLLFAFKESYLTNFDLNTLYAVVEHNGVEHVIEYKNWTWMEAGGVKYFVVEYAGIAARQMGDDVTVTIYDGEGNRISESKTTSIRDYAMAKLENSANAEFKTALVDMLNYGAAAQVKFGYKTDDLVNSQLTDEQQALGTAAMNSVKDHREVSDKNYYLGTNLRFTNKTNLLFAFKNIDAKNCTAVFTWTDHNGDEHSVEAAFKSTSGGYAVELDELVVADARQIVTCTVYDQNDKVIVTVEDSIESSVARVSDANRALYEAFMMFADSAYAYLHK